jgi:PAS domain S-box-containing protein
MSSRIDFQALFENSPNAYMLLDRELRYVAANAAYLRETASRLEDLVGRRVLEVFPNDPGDPENSSATLLRQSLERVVATGQPDFIALIPYRVPAFKDGQRIVEERYWSATHTPIPGADGEVAFILQHTVDVTELQKLRQDASGAPLPGTDERVGAQVLRRAHEVQETNVSLRLEHGDLRRLFEQAPGFMASLRGPNHVIELANAAYHQLVGHRDIIGKPLREALPELQDQAYFDLLERVYTSGTPFAGRGMRVLLQREPGAALTEAVVDFIYQPIFDAAGAVAGILALGYDITLHKHQEAERGALLESERRAREAAEAAEQRQRFLAESIPQQVWTATPAGNLDFVNARVVEYFGASEGELLGSGWQTALHPDDVRPCLQRWQHSLRTGEEYECEFRLRRADGRYRWHLARALAFYGPDERIAKWFGTNTDMDDLTRAREELQKRAEFDRQLVGIVSHDLRNPLNAIGMATALLMKLGRLDEQHVKIVRRITSSSERAVRLIRDFLDFTQARVSGEIPVHPSDANIRQIARQVFDELTLAHPDRRATIEHCGEEIGSWDADRVAQLIGNLLANAFQHGSPSGEVHLATRGAPDEVVIEIHNEGNPIPPDHLSRVFEPFERSAAAGARDRSIGLGLYISGQIVAAHGGAIEVRSTAGEGTLFRVRLPRVARQGTHDAPDDALTTPAPLR